MSKKNKNNPPPADTTLPPVPQPFVSTGNGTPISLLGQNIQQATNNVRGGYAARGLAGSGIAQAGENNATNQLIMQDMQRQEGNLTNLIAAGSGQQSNSSSGGGGGITVICTELHDQGWLDDETYRLDGEFATTLPLEVYIGYYVWARHVATAMHNSRVVTRLVAPFALSWARHMSGKRSLLGRFLMAVGVPLCGWIGERMRRSVEARSKSIPSLAR